MKFNEKHFQRLIETQSNKKPLISIYIPTHRYGAVQEDRLSFKNALKDASEKLLDENLYPQFESDKKLTQKYLNLGHELLDNDNFWLHQSDGLAVFLNDESIDYYTLPVKFEKRVFAGNRYYTRPLHAIINKDRRFFLLALSQGGVRFFEVHNHHIFPVIIKDLVPENLEKALNKQHESNLQFHSVAASDPVYHGQGGRRDTQIDDLKEYFRQVDNGIMEMLHDEDQPMILAGVDYLIPLYKEVSQYPHIIEDYVGGNMEDEDPVVLHEKAWKIMGPRVEKQMEEKRNQFNFTKKKGLASTELQEIILASKAGKIEELFIDQEAGYQWGEIIDQSETYKVRMDDDQKKDNSCLLNLAALYTYKNGGKVFHMEKDKLPESDTTANAIFRY